MLMQREISLLSFEFIEHNRYILGEFKGMNSIIQYYHSRSSFIYDQRDISRKIDLPKIFATIYQS